MNVRVAPRATLRLQFHKGFKFTDAAALAPYFAELGVSHIYASPIMAARAGSMHGYDVIDPTRVNPELGGEDGLKRLSEALRRAGLGLIVDIVPNHMAATLENPWWTDVLRHGRASRYAGYFDIDWDCEDLELRDKVFLPWLNKPLCEAERAGDIKELGLPVPGAYFLGWWRTANDRINWRRFFDINDLVCLRMDDDEAFEAVHAAVAGLYSEGIVDGVRVDHIDGLDDPAAYCRKLRRRLAPASPERPYIVVEKILMHGETLPSNWGCDGTTGYDFMDEVTGLLHDPQAEPILAAAWAGFSLRPADFQIEERTARRDILRRSFAAPLEACVAAFEALARSDPRGREISRPALRRALVELLVNFPVYRSYGTADDRPARCRPFVERAVQGAKATGLAGDRWIVDALHRWMCEPVCDSRAIARFQQLSAPVAAKAVEDTAFYRYGRLLSRNDVGFDAERFGYTASEFHARMQRRHQDHPNALLATATHDHKRGEDVRARLAVLSERPQHWIECCARWLQRCAELRNEDAPDSGDIVMLFQMIVGAWPLELALDDAYGRRIFADRLAGWQQKALREAKLRTDWTDPDAAYETAARDFLMGLLVANRTPDLLEEIFRFVHGIAAAGAVNGVTQLLLKLTVPGVPDIYQGADSWDFSLVDPDNRRPVDYARRRQFLIHAPFDELVAHWRTGRLKQALIARALAVRRALPDLFAQGTYEPLAIQGEKAEHAVGFLRRHRNDAALVIVPRLPARLLVSTDAIAFDPAAWRDTRFEIPAGLELFDALGDSHARLDRRIVALQDLMAGRPLIFFSTRRDF